MSLRAVTGRIWAAPATLLGLLLALAALPRGRIRARSGVFEAWGGLLGLLLRRAVPLRGGARAMTVGHVILGRDADSLERCREHERIHVQQYERWGLIFLPAYGLASLWAWLRGGHFYHDNFFEQDACARAEIGHPGEDAAR